MGQLHCQRNGKSSGQQATVSMPFCAILKAWHDGQMLAVKQNSHIAVAWFCRHPVQPARHSMHVPPARQALAASALYAMQQQLLHLLCIPGAIAPQCFHPTSGTHTWPACAECNWQWFHLGMTRPRCLPMFPPGTMDPKIKKCHMGHPWVNYPSHQQISTPVR